MNIRIGELSGSDATNALHQTLKSFNEQSQVQTAQMLSLTKVIALLTAVMLLGVLVQIYLAMKAPPSGSATEPVAGPLPDLKAGETYRYLGDGKFEHQKVIDWKDLK